MKVMDQEFVMLKFKDNWLLLHCSAHKIPLACVHLHCTTFGQSKNYSGKLQDYEIAYKLEVRLVLNITSPVVYNLEAEAQGYGWAKLSHLGYLIISEIDQWRRFLHLTVTLV